MRRSGAPTRCSKAFIPGDGAPQAGTRSRARCLAGRVLALNQQELDAVLARVITALSDRHRDIEEVLLCRFQEVSGAIDGALPVIGGEPMIATIPASWHNAA